MAGPSLFLHQAGAFLPTPLARGPWDLRFLHGSPIAALLARSVERSAKPGFHVVRLTIDLMRAVPFVPLTAGAEVVRDGGRIQVIVAALQAGGEEMARATALLMREGQSIAGGAIELDAAAPPPPEAFQPMGSPNPGQEAYHTAVEWRPTEPFGQSERPALWVRIGPALLPGEPLSPLARAAATADALSPLANFAPSFRQNLSGGFINADITLYLQRRPVGEWLCLTVTSRQGGPGYAIADGPLRDRLGLVGRIALASLATTATPLGGAPSAEAQSG